MGSLTWTYSDAGANGDPAMSLTITTSDTLQNGTYQGTNGPIVYSYYTITGASGSFNGTTVTGVDAVKSVQTSDRIYTSQYDSYGSSVFNDIGSLQYDAVQLTLNDGNDLFLGSDQSGLDWGVLTPSQNAPNPVFPFVPVNTGYFSALSLVAPPCFAAGTRIATASGVVAVERLAPGEEVLLARGGSARVRWIGRREVHCDRHPTPRDVWPVCVTADAFGPGAPQRDLWLSPDHAVFIPGRRGRGGMLVPVRYLINGATIRQEPRERVTYLHVELDRHDVLLAEGLPCESYLDTGNRAAFANGGGAVQAHPDFARAVWQVKACAPLVTSGRRLVALRRRLLRRATGSLGHALGDDPGLVVTADGVPLTGQARDGAWQFDLPAGTREVTLSSHVFIPAQIMPEAGDTRRLGVAVGAVMLDGAPLELDDARFLRGWHAPELSHRWTSGAGRLDVRGSRQLSFALAIAARYWRPRAAA